MINLSISNLNIPFPKEFKDGSVSLLYLCSELSHSLDVAFVFSVRVDDIYIWGFFEIMVTNSCPF